ncbi:ThiF family adenylyltransferase [Rhodococcus sp. 1168]|uniref:ThiF family adenylyltransferase n=1 Tax=Rhodococcus sp. 1168 TaxID=2018041 RepID=UPI000B5B0316
MIEVLHPTEDAARIRELRRPNAGLAYVDGWATARSELIAIDSFGSLPFDWSDERDVDRSSRFVHIPWRSTLVRLPDSVHFYRLRTARNRFLLDDDEQTTWGSALIGIAGLSVGSSVAAVCSLTGARRFRIADPDTLGPSNLNRLQGSVCDLGVAKVTLAQRRILEIDPYSDVSGFPGGYTSADVTFLRSSGGERLAVLVEEMDDLAMKLEIRLQARALRIPVVMATDNGDNVILDVERYDLDADYPPFHGRAGDLTECSESELNEPANRMRLANAIVGSDVTPRTRYSLTQVGRSLPSWPQLGTAANAAGSTAALAA